MPQHLPLRRPAPPVPVARGLRAMLTVRKVTRRQWPTAIRTTVSVAGPALIGWLIGDVPAGLLVSLGGFASLYGGGRPYVNRARLLVLVSVAQAVAVAIGIAASVDPLGGVLAVTVIAVAASLLCNTFAIQPGAYQIALTCAAGTALHAQGADPVGAGVLVLLGGLVATAASLAGALSDPFGPERLALGEAADAVADYVDVLEHPALAGADLSDGAAYATRNDTGAAAATGAGPSAAELAAEPSAAELAAERARDEDALRHRAAVAMHQAWLVLAHQQPRRRRVPRGLVRLQESGRALQLLLADAMRRRPEPGTADRARALGQRSRRRSGAVTRQVVVQQLLARPSATAQLRAAVQPGSRSVWILLRVGVASLVAGLIGAGLELSHAYWAIAAAVLVLSQGLDQRRTVQRGLERTVGTVAGLGLAAMAMATRPTGLLLVAMITVSVFCAQLLVQRNYAAAAVFITCSALLMAGGYDTPAARADLLQSRGLDTALGCLVAVVVFGVLSRKKSSGWLPTALGDTVRASAAVVDELTPVRVTRPAALAARSRLQQRLIQQAEAYENAINGFPAQQAAAGTMWPVVVAVERLGYRTLAEAWRLVDVSQDDRARSRPLPDLDPPPSAGLRRLAAAVEHGTSPRTLGATPVFLSRDVGDLRRLLPPARGGAASALGAAES